MPAELIRGVGNHITEPIRKYSGSEPIAVVALRELFAAQVPEMSVE
jgi:hypothetical protein